MDRRTFLQLIAAASACLPVVTRAVPANDFARYDFGLDAAGEQRASRLQSESVVIDLMFQGPCGYRSLTDDLFEAELALWAREPSGEVFVRLLQRVSQLAAEGKLPDYQAIWRESGLTATNLQVIGDISDGAHEMRLREIAAYPGYQVARTAADIRSAAAGGTACSFLNYQYLLPAVTDLAWFEQARAAGIRMIGLTYNNQNQVGGGCTSDDQGLTAFGRQAVAAMNEHGILVDTAHAGARTTIEACKVSRLPVISSHAGASALFMHDRNKSDDEMRALANTGGLCGVVTVPGFLSTELPGSIEQVLDHIDYIANLVGIDHVAVGTDWPMELPRWALASDGPMKRWLLDMGFQNEQVDFLNVNLIGFDDYRDWPNITRGLVSRGYSDGDIQKIIGGNALRVLDAVWL